MKKIKLPEGMLKAAEAAGIERDEFRANNLEVCLEAALLWLTEHPIVPTDEQAKQIICDLNDSGYCIADSSGNTKIINSLAMEAAGRIVSMSAQRRMFDSPEPEVSDSVKRMSQGLMGYTFTEKERDYLFDIIQTATHTGKV